MRPITPSRYHVDVLVAGFLLGLIVLTGAAVRLTQAGLGCENWPACTEERLVPEWGFHPWIEFGNRLLSGVVALGVAVAVLNAHRRRPRRTDLIKLAWGLVAGVAAQIVLGGITVRVDLHPAFVGLHFLLSMVLLANVVVLWVRASSGPDRPRQAVDQSTWWLGWAVTIQAGVVLVSGTLVTGTGPNGGDSRAERLRFDLSEITRVHSVLVWCLTALAVALALRLHGRLGGPDGLRPPGSPAEPGPPPEVARARRVSRWLLGALVAQGAVGYLQFALGVPPALVELHVFGAMVVWCLALLLKLQLARRAPLEQPADEPTIDLVGATAPGRGTDPSGYDDEGTGPGDSSTGATPPASPAGAH